MGNVLLPYVEPMYSTYHFLSNAGIPAKQNKTADIWYYNSTVKWYCSRDFLHGNKSFDLNLTCGNIWSIPFLEIIGVSTKIVRRCASQVVKTMLDDGYYVEFEDVDNYYIKGKSMYSIRHYYHDGLIIGYNDENNTFSIAAYNQHGIFTVFETPQDCFIQAVIYSCEQGVFGHLHAVKAKNNQQVLKPEFIYCDLNAYLNPRDDYYSHHEYDRIWGIDVYKCLAVYIDKIIDESIPSNKIDQRVFRLIWEHKKCMLGRIKALENYYEWDNSLSLMYNDLVTKSEQARMLSCKYTINQDNRCLKRIQIIITEIRTVEIDILNALLFKLGEEFKSKR